MNIWCLQCRNLPLIFEQISEAALSVTYTSPVSNCMVPSIYSKSENSRNFQPRRLSGRQDQRL